MTSLPSDVRFALRGLRKEPGFTVVAVLTLALGIGTSAAIFSLVNAVLLRSLPYERAESLVLLWGNVMRQVVERRGASIPDFEDWRAQSASFEGLAACWDATLTLFGGDEPERIAIEAVSAGYFELLGVNAVRGRLFTEADDRPGAEQVAVMGEDLWARRFGRDPSVVGRTLATSTGPVTIVGIVRSGFGGLTDRKELWVTTAIVGDARANRGSRWFPVVARLKPGVTTQRAQADLDRIARALELAYPDTNEKRGVEVARLTDEIFGQIRPALLVVQGAVVLVLLIAAANVAGLLLARAERRQREMAVRTALGASRARLYTQLATESVVLSLVAGGLGIVMSGWITDGLLALSPVTLPGFVDVRVDLSVLAFALAVSFSVGMLLGIAPAWRMPAASLHEVVRESGGRTTLDRKGHRLRHAIVVAEIAVAVMLLVGAGLLARSLSALSAIDPGFVTDRLLTLRVSLPAPAAPDGSSATAQAGIAPPDAAQPPEAGAHAAAILARLRGVPAVARVSAGSDIPLAGEASAIFYTAEGHVVVGAEQIPRIYRHRVASGFFQTLGLPLVRGRDFVEADERAESTAVIVSEGVVRRFWPNEDPIGKRIKAGRADSKAPWLDIVGVVRESRYRALPANPTSDPDLFLPFAPQARAFALFVRTEVPAGTIVETVRRAIREAAPAATIYNVATMEERANQQLVRQRFVSWLTGAFAFLALVLSAIGLYGVLAQAVTRRTPEIGVRVALGADRGAISRLIFGESLRLVLAGVAIGAIGALVSSRLIQALLFGVGPADPATIATVVLLLVVVSVVATWVPARRATSVDPLVALRSE